MNRTLSELARACDGELKGADAAFAGVVIDSRKLTRGDLFVALAGEHTDGHEFLGAAEAAGAAGALVSQDRGATLPLVQVRNVEQALSAAARHWRSGFHGPLIGVAGSNGKTTVKEMLASILAQQGECLATRGNLNNHLGVPLTLLGLKGSERTAVIEIGANRAGEVASLMKIAQPTVGLITNAGAEHLEGFGSLEGVARAEGEMVAGLDAGALAVAGVGNGIAQYWWTRSLTLAPPSAVVPFNYLSLVWATILGLVVWGDVPTPHLLIGAVIVVCSGLYILWRETVRRRRPRAAALDRISRESGNPGVGDVPVAPGPPLSRG